MTFEDKVNKFIEDFKEYYASNILLMKLKSEVERKNFNNKINFYSTFSIVLFFAYLCFIYLSIHSFIVTIIYISLFCGSALSFYYFITLPFFQEPKQKYDNEYLIGSFKNEKDFWVKFELLKKSILKDLILSYFNDLSKIDDVIDFIEKQNLLIKLEKKIQNNLKKFKEYISINFLEIVIIKIFAIWNLISILTSIFAIFIWIILKIVQIFLNSIIENTPKGELIRLLKNIRNKNHAYSPSYK